MEIQNTRYLITGNIRILGQSKVALWANTPNMSPGGQVLVKLLAYYDK